MLKALDGQSFPLSTTAPGIEDTLKDFDDIKAVPNPYLIRAEWDRSENTRSIYFTNVPDGATIGDDPTEYRVSVLGVADLTYRTQVVSTQTFRPLELFTMLAVIYFFLCFILSQGVGWLERRMAVSERY